MKRPNKNSATNGNIVFDDDITMTGTNKAFGKDLHSAMENLWSRTAKLENYLKWIYKYGGVGGTGGGGETATSYTVYAELNHRKVVEDPTAFINLGSSGTFPLLIKISKPGGASYKVNCTFTDNTGSIINTINETLNLDNSYTLERVVNISKNGVLNIKVTDSIYNETTPLSTRYITDPYRFTGDLINNSGRAYSNEIFTSDILSNGLYLRLNYQISVATEVSYKLKVTTPKLTFNSEGFTAMEDLIVSNTEEGDYIIDIIQFLRKFDYGLTESNSGNYSISVELQTKIVGDLETNSYTPLKTPISFTIVPKTLYLLVQSTSGTLYQVEQEPDSVSTDDLFSPGSITFKVKPYFENVIGKSCTIDYKLGDEFEWQTISTNLRDTQQITIYSTRPGENSISFVLKYDNKKYPTQEQSNVGEGTYYFYIKNSTFDGGWWHQFEKNTDRPFYDDLNHYFKVTEWSPEFNPFNATFGRNPIKQTVNKSPVTLTNLTCPTGSDGFNTIVNIGIEYNTINEDGAPILKITAYDDTELTLYQNRITLGANSIEDDRLFIPKTDYSSFTGLNNTEDYHLISIVSRQVKKLGNTDNRGREVIIYIDGVIEACFKTFLYSPGTPSNNLTVKDISLYSVNANFNLFDIAYFSPIESKVSTEYYIPEDVTIYQYYLKYKETLLSKTLTEEEINLLTYYDNIDFNPENGDIFCSEDAMNNIARNLNVPVMAILVDDNKNGNYKDLLGGYYLESSTEELETKATLKWSGLKGKTSLTDISFPNRTISNTGSYIDWTSNIHFYVKIQGSSTKGYHIKNYTLTLKDDENLYIPLFSPNFKNNDTTTFLPEHSFTLKADVVDSSHSNNTSIGNFVNDITTKFKTSPTSVDDAFSGYIKNCLTGFPFLIFMKFIDPNKSPDAQDENYYYHGVYNFNLGRESEYNLGYKDYNVFCDSNGKSILEDAPDSGGFSFHMVTKSSSVVKNGVITAEIQGNSSFLDFSQFDESLLFQNDSVSDENVTTMFGKITDENPDVSYIRGENLQNQDARNILQRFVEKVTYAGGYVFTQLKKTFSDDGSAGVLYGYGSKPPQGYKAVGKIKVWNEDLGEIEEKTLPLNQVPNYRHQFIRTVSGITPKAGLTRPGTLNDLMDLVRKDENDPDAGIPLLDFDSVSEYYTICMAFGLIDSVQKNLTLKTWTADKESGLGTFYVAFYDMDTCLGIDNAGKKVNYTAFSDYWTKNESESDGTSTSETTSSGTVSYKTITPISATVYRDYSPSGGEYFDVASSYLFAIPKYATYIAGKLNLNASDSAFTEKITNWPRQLWEKWRSRRNPSDHKIGCLESADYFIKTYFSNNLGSVGIPLINANYRAKYLVQLYYSGDTTNSKDELGKFNGTRIARVKEWLNNRLHLLDAYFNIARGVNNPIMFYRECNEEIDGEMQTFYKYTSTEEDTSADHYMSEPTISEYTSATNPDVYINSDIFDKLSLQSSIPFVVTVRAKENSPLIITCANWTKRYLIGGNNYYQIPVPVSGTQAYRLLGSKNWTYMDSINGFHLDGTFYINTQYIDQLVGDDNSSEAKELTFDNSATDNILMPSLKTISLTSPKYKGTLKLVGTNYTNLGTIDLSNSRIGLNMQNTTCTELNLSNVNGSNNQYNIVDCLNLSKITIVSAYMSSLIIKPIHPDIITKNCETSFGKVTSSNVINLANITPTTSNNQNTPFGKTGSGFYLKNTHIREINISNTKINEDRSRIEIDGDDTLYSITIAGFSVVVIKNCQNLNKINISDPEAGIGGDKLRRLCIQNCGNAGTDLTINSTERGHLNLTDFSDLNFVNFRECTNITSIEFSNTGVYLDYDAFYSDSNLSTIDGKAYIIGTTTTGTRIRPTFYLCKNFKLTKSNGTTCCDLFVIEQAVSLNSTFSIGNSISKEGEGKITRTLAKTFIERIPTNNNITDITNMFCGNRIEYNETLLVSDIKSTKNYIDMSVFKKVTNVSGAFNYNLISAWHPKWFSFGADVDTINSFENYMGRETSTTVTTVMNVFYDIIEKIRTIGANNANTSGYQYVRLKIISDNKSNPTVIDHFKASDFFFPSKEETTRYPTKVETLQLISFSGDAIVDFSGLFSYGHWNSLNTIYRFEFETTNTSGNSIRVNNIMGLDGLFNLGYLEVTLPPLEGGILDSFRVDFDSPLTITSRLDGLTYTGQTFIDLYGFVAWENYRGKTVDFFRREYTSSGYSDWDEGNFTIRKYISYDNFKSLCGILFNSNCNWTGFSNLFRNCTVVASPDQHVVIELTDKDTSEDDSLSMTGVKSINSMFDNFRIIRKQPGYTITKEDLVDSNYLESEYVEFNYDRLLGIFPSLTSAAFAFRNVKFKRALPIDFWRKRKKTTEDVYIKIDDSGLDIYQSPDENYFNNEVLGRYFKKATLYTYSYNLDLENLQSCFYNTKWFYGIENGETIQAKNFNPEQLSDVPKNSIVIDSTGEVIDEVGYYYYKLASGSNNAEIGGTITKIYYWTLTKQVNGLESSTEFSDIAELTPESNPEGIGEYVEECTINGSGDTIKNYSVSNTANAISRSFIAPDILYPIKPNCSLRNTFYSDGSDSMEGLIPKNLLKNSTSPNINGLLTNQSIIPRKIGVLEQTDSSNPPKVERVSYYTFVPENFTRITSLEGAFKFKILLPNSSTESGDTISYSKYYILLNTSFKNNRSSITAFRNPFPEYCIDGDNTTVGLWRTSTNGWYNTANTSYDKVLYYGLMYNPEYDTNGVLVGGSEGIDISTSGFRNATFDNMLTAGGTSNKGKGTVIMRYLTGYLFSYNTTLNQIKRAATSSSSSTLNPIFGTFYHYQYQNCENFTNKALILPGITGQPGAFNNSNFIAFSYDFLVHKSQLPQGNKNNYDEFIKSSDPNAKVVLYPRD